MEDAYMYSTSIDDKQQDCITFYDNTNYNGTSKKYCWKDTKQIETDWDFNDKVVSLKLDDGMYFQGWIDKNFHNCDHAFHGGHYGSGYCTEVNDIYDWKASSPDVGPNYPKTPDGAINSEISSWKLFKDCSNDKWLWSKDCSSIEPQINILNNGYNAMLQRKKDKCNNNNINLNNDNTCKYWCTINPDECKDSLKNYCTKEENVTKPECKIWCNNNKGVCDIAATNYCSNHLNDNTFCGCFDENAKLTLNTYEYNIIYNNPNSNTNRAYCWNNNCVQHGYWTTNMESASDSCPGCIQINQFSNVNANNIDISKLTQICESNSISTQPIKQDEKNKDEKNEDEKNEDEKNEDELYYYYLIILILLFIILIVIISVVYKYKNDINNIIK